MVTGMRRGELLGLRWRYVDLDEGTLSAKRVYFARQGHKVEKDTKTHQERRRVLDPATVELLRAHRKRAEERLNALGLELTGDAYVFSPDPAHARPYHPDSVSHRYTRMVGKLGIKTHRHALRHYNATELIRNGVDIRTVAGRLGHGGGGTTTLRIYTAFVPESDRCASTIIAGQMPALPVPDPTAVPHRD